MSTVAVEAKLVLGPELNGISMTPEEFDAVEEYDDTYSYELVRGVLVVNPIPSALETGPNELLAYLLLLYQRSHPQGSALDLTLPEQYVRTAVSRRRADRLIWAGLGRLPDWEHEVPTIVVEFVSARLRDWRRDYEEKRAEYMQLRIKEYWIIDRFRRTMTVFRQQGKKVQATLVPEQEVYRTPLLPGFELPLAQILAVADRLNQPQKLRPTARNRRRRD